MFNSPVLDLVILLSFTYFIGSLILSAINEAIAGTFRLRQADLKKGIYTFFLCPSWRSFVKNTFLDSPHIQTLMKSSGRLPVYIPARNFVLAIVEHLEGEAYKLGTIQSKDKKGMDKNPILPKDLITVLDTIMKQVSAFPKEQITLEFEKRLEEFYNLTMDRVTGWYKRRVRRILLVIGLLLSVILNIDTIRIANDAMSDKTRLAKTVDNITSNLVKIDSLRNKKIVISDTLGKISIKETTGNLEEVLLEYQQSSSYRLGYSSREDFINQWRSNFFLKLLGVLLTAFALQLGANYWFDLMNTAVNVRAAGRKPDQKRPDTKTS